MLSREPARLLRLGRCTQRASLSRIEGLASRVCSSRDITDSVCTRSPSTSAVGATAVSDAAGVPRCDLLDQPRITVGIIEGEERPIARAFGVGAGEPCLRGERRAVPHLTDVDATADE